MTTKPNKECQRGVSVLELVAAGYSKPRNVIGTTKITKGKLTTPQSGDKIPSARFAEIRGQNIH